MAGQEQAPMEELRATSQYPVCSSSISLSWHFCLEDREHVLTCYWTSANVMTGAYLLRMKMQRFGNTWQAVGAYHSTTDVYNLNYQNKIWNTLQKVIAKTQPQLGQLNSN